MSADPIRLWDGVAPGSEEWTHPVELHPFERGGHGFGMSRTGLPCDQWPELFLAWLRSQ